MDEPQDSRQLQAEVVRLQAELKALEVASTHQYSMLRALFTRSPAAILVSRLHDGLIVDVNNRWEELLGIGRDEAVGKTSLELGLWRHGVERAEAMARVRDGRAANGMEVAYTRRDGKQLLLHIDGTPMELNGERHMVVYLSDVSVQHEAQKEVERSQLALEKLNDELRGQLEMFELTEQVSRVGHWSVAQGATRPTWSKGLYQLSGYAWEEGMSFEKARSGMHPDDAHIFMQARRSMDGEMVQYRWTDENNVVRWLRSRMRRQYRADGSYVDFGVVQDFTVEHEAREVMEQQLATIQRLTSRLPQMVFQFAQHTATSGRFVFISDASQAIFGVTPRQAQENANRIFRLIHPEDAAAAVQSMNMAVQDGQTWAHEFRIQLPDGSVRTLFGKAITVMESTGQSHAYGSVTDITDHKASQVILQESEARFRALTELSSDWYWEQDEEFRFVQFAGVLPSLKGRQPDAAIGKTRWELPAFNMSGADWDAHRADLQAQRVFKDLELQTELVDGSYYWMSLSGAPIFDAQGRFKGYRGVGRDITARRRAEEEIERLAFFDVLTDLPNRRLLVDRLQQALVTSARDKAPGALLFIDLDNFKDLNDTQGHDVGDLLLRQVAQRLVDSVREADTVARLGGDEFVVLLQNLDARIEFATTQVEQVGRKILASLNQPYVLTGQEHHSTPSIGVTLFLEHLQSVDELLKQADLAMYEAKAAGRNTLRFFDPTMQALVAQRTALEQELRHGLQRGELVLHYQPVVDETSRMVGVEALVRWQNPQRGLVPPMEFIPVAEQTGLILPLGQWVLQQACIQLVNWAAHPSTQDLTIAVNVSARQFKQPEFASQVLALLRQTGANPMRLKIELTESLLLSDSQDAIAKMTELRQAGVHFALDDFGTGYSSLSYLKLLPLQQLKIDQSFVRDVLTDPNDAAIARTVLALGKSLGFTVVAEGVETAGQRDFLLQSGCTLFQGYLFGRPVPLADLPLPAL